MTLLEHAINYAKHGLPVFPCRPDKHPMGDLCPHGFKNASKDEAQLVEWWGKYPDASIAVPTGPKTGVDLLDIDIYKAGVEERLKQLTAELGPLPSTREVRSGGGGRNLWLQSAPGLRCANDAFGPDYPGIDVKAEGGYMIVPPSRHENGNVYRFTNQLDPAPWPAAYLKRLMQRRPATESAPASAAGDKIKHPHRHRHLFSLAGTLRKRGTCDEAILAGLRAENQARCEPPLSDSEVVKMAAGIKRYPSGETTAAVEEPLPEPETFSEFPESAWRGVFREYRAALCGKSEAPEAYHFAAVWSVVAARLERRVWFPYFLRVYPNAYLVCTGPTGDHKTSAARLAVNSAEALGQRVLRGGGSGEGLADDLQQGPLLVLLEEFSVLLKSARWEGSTLAPTLTAVFDCPPRYELKYRKNPIGIDRPTMSLVAGTTPEWFWRDARDVDLTGGLGNRLLFFDGPPQPLVALPGLVDVNFLAAALSKVTQTAETEAQFTAQAKELWKGFYADWREALKKRGPLEAAMTKRSDVYILKLALAYAALEGTLPFIEVEQLAAAILVVEYAAGAVKRLIDLRQAGTNPVKDLESRILAAVKNAKQTPTTKRYLQQWLHKYVPSAREFNQAFDALLKSEQIRIDCAERGRTWVWPAD